MNAEAAIYGILSADSTLTSLLATTTSIFPEVAPQKSPNPCIVYSESTPEYSDNKSGVSGLDVNVIQVDVYAATIATRNAIGARIRTLLDRYSGTVNSIKVQSVELVYSHKLYDPESEAYRQTFDFRLRQVI